MCEEYDSQYSQNLSTARVHQANLWSYFVHVLDFKVLQAKVTFVKTSKVTFLLSSLKEEVKNGVSAPDGGKKKEKRRRRHFTSAPPSVSSTSIDQWEINALTAAVSVNEMFGGAIQKMHPRGFRLRETEANEDTHRQAHRYSHKHTHTYKDN